MGKIVSIVGRPNVGKSTLFNRLTGTRRAIVDDVAGTTRDRQYGKVLWNGTEFSIIDTGGWVVGSDDVFEEEIRRQVRVAIEESDVILFVVDVVCGLTDLDMEIATLLRQESRKVILVANKTDTYDLQYGAAEFYRLGLGDPLTLSASNGSGTGDMLDEVLRHLSVEQPDDEAPDDELPKFAIVGRPNAGKSSLLNALMGEDRNIVTDIAGTTRDSIYTRYNKFGHDFYLVDTAGIRKKAKVNEDLEYYSVIRAIRAIESADVCILMVDATRGLEGQDLNIFSLIQRNKKGLVVCVNKWDLIPEADKTAKGMKAIEASIRERLAPFTDFEVLFISATGKQRIFRVVEQAVATFSNMTRKVSTHELNEVLLPLIERYPPPAIKGKYIKIKYVTQLPNSRVPSFVFFANLPQYVKEPYRRYLENQIRKHWAFRGTPVQIFLRSKSK